MEECQRCKEVDEDRRTLWMSCFYEMDELGMPFSHVCPAEAPDVPRKFYTMRVCKECRGLWMAMIKFWYGIPDNKQASCGSGIFVREFGATIEISEAEWNKRNPGIEPVRFHADE